MSTWNAPQALYDAVVAGPVSTDSGTHIGDDIFGDAIDLGSVKSEHVVSSYYAPTADSTAGASGTRYFQGSLDGVNWYSLGASTTIPAVPDFTYVTDSPARYVRASAFVVTNTTPGQAKFQVSMYVASRD
jgi:hypothetical protein